MSFHGRQFRPRGGPPYALGASQSRVRDVDFRDMNPRASFRDHETWSGRGRYVPAESDDPYYSNDRLVPYRAEYERPNQDRSRSPPKHERYRGREYPDSERLRGDDRRDHKVANSPPHREHRESKRSHSPQGADDYKSNRHVAHSESTNVRDHKSLGSRGVAERLHMEESAVQPSIMQHDSKIAAVEKAKEMALRTRQIISKLGGLKQLASIPDSSTSESRDSGIQVSKPIPTRNSPPRNVTGKVGLTDSKSAISKMLQNESLIKYAFTIPIGDDSNKSADLRMQTSESERSVPNRSSAFVAADSEPYETADDDNYKLFDYSHGMPSNSRINEPLWSKNASSPVTVQQPAAVSVATSDQLKGGHNRIETEATGCDPTIANILKSIGFNFDMSNLMQEKTAVATSTAVVDSKIAAQHAPLASKSTNPNILQSGKANYTPGVVHQLYEDMAHKYRAEQRLQVGLRGPEVLPPAPVLEVSQSTRSSLQQLQSSYEAYEQTVKEDIFRDPSPEMRLKFKTKGNNKGGLLYEDFSDSDESFADTACSKPLFSDNFTAEVATSSTTGNEQNVPTGPNQAAAKTVAAEEHDWVQSTEAFIRRLQQPRPESLAQSEKQPSRQVTIVPKRDNSRAASTPRGETDVEPQRTSPQHHIRLMETVLPLEELRNIKKTIVVSEVGSGSAAKVIDKTERGTFDASRDSDRGKDNKDRTVGNSKLVSEAVERIKSMQSRLEPQDRYTDNKDKAVIGSNESGSEAVERLKKKQKPSEATSELKSPGPIDSETLERQKKIDALVKELEGLRRQQSALWRRKKREKDGHKDPILIENSKLQEEISKQIVLLKLASKQASENVAEKSPGKKLILKKDEDDKSSSENESPKSKKDKKRAKLRRSRSPEYSNWHSRSRTESKNSGKAETEVKQYRNRRIARYEYFDGGNHFCRCCNHISVNVFEHCQHLQTALHKQNVDPSDKPWTKAPVKPETLNITGSLKGNITALRIRGVEFLMSTQAFYCGLCEEFFGSSALVEAHFKSETHNNNYTKHIDDNPYYERRLNLEKSAMSVMTPKTQSASHDTKTILPVVAETATDRLPTNALEEAKARAKRLASGSASTNIPDQEEDILLPPFKKSRVIPKSGSKVDDDELAKLLLTKNDKSKLDEVESEMDEVGEVAKTTSLNKSSVNETNSQEDTLSSKAENTTVTTKKSLPFIGKRPNMKAPRANRNVSSEKQASEIDNKIPIKIVSKEQAVVNFESKESSLKDFEEMESAVVQMGSSTETISEVVDMEVEDADALGSFLTIGDPGSRSCHSVPVVKVNTIGPQTLSSYLLLHQSSKCAGDGGLLVSDASKNSGREFSNATASKMCETKDSQSREFENRSNVVVDKVECKTARSNVTTEVREPLFSSSADNELAKLLLSKSDMSNLDDVEWETEDVGDIVKTSSDNYVPQGISFNANETRTESSKPSQPSTNELTKLLLSKSDMSSIDDIEWETDEVEDVVKTSSSDKISANKNNVLEDSSSTVSAKAPLPITDEVAKLLLSKSDMSNLDDVEWEVDEVEDVGKTSSSDKLISIESNVQDSRSSAKGETTTMSAKAPLPITDEVAKLLLSKSDMSNLDDVEWEVDEVEDVGKTSSSDKLISIESNVQDSRSSAKGETTTMSAKAPLPITDEVAKLLLSKSDMSNLDDVEWEVDEVEDVDKTSPSDKLISIESNVQDSTSSAKGETTTMSAKAPLPITDEVAKLLLSKSDMSNLDDVEWEVDEVEDVGKTSPSDKLISIKSNVQDSTSSAKGETTTMSAKAPLPITDEVAKLLLSKSDMSNLDDVEWEMDEVEDVGKTSLSEEYCAIESNLIKDTPRTKADEIPSPFADEIAKLLLLKSDMTKLEDVDWETDDVEDDAKTCSMIESTVNENKLLEYKTVNCEVTTIAAENPSPIDGQLVNIETVGAVGIVASEKPSETVEESLIKIGVTDTSDAIATKETISPMLEEKELIDRDDVTTLASVSKLSKPLELSAAFERPDIHSSDVSEMVTMAVSRPDIHSSDVSEMVTAAVSRPDIHSSDVSEMMTTAVSRPDIHSSDVSEMETADVSRPDIHSSDVSDMMTTAVSRPDIHSSDVSEMMTTAVSRPDIHSSDVSEMKTTDVSRPDIHSSDVSEMVTAAVSRPDIHSSDVSEMMTTAVSRPDIHSSDVSEMVTTDVSRPDIHSSDVSEMVTAAVSRPDIHSSDVSEMVTMAVSRPDIHSSDVSEMVTAAVSRPDIHSSDVSEMVTMAVSRPDIHSSDVSEMVTADVSRPDIHSSDVNEMVTADVSRPDIHSSDVSEMVTANVSRPDIHSSDVSEMVTTDVSRPDIHSSDVSEMVTADVSRPDIHSSDVSEMVTTDVSRPDIHSSDVSEMVTAAVSRPDIHSSDVSEMVTAAVSRPDIHSSDVSEMVTADVSRPDIHSSDVSEMVTADVSRPDIHSSDVSEMVTTDVSRPDIHSSDFSEMVTTAVSSSTTNDQQGMLPVVDMCRSSNNIIMVASDSDRLLDTGNETNSSSGTVTDSRCQIDVVKTDHDEAIMASQCEDRLNIDSQKMLDCPPSSTQSTNNSQFEVESCEASKNHSPIFEQCSIENTVRNCDAPSEPRSNEDSPIAVQNTTELRDDLELSLTVDNNTENKTEDYKSHDQQALRLPRDEEVAILLPHIAEQFMQPAITDETHNRIIVNSDDFDIIDDCNTDGDDVSEPT